MDQSTSSKFCPIQQELLELVDSLRHELSVKDQKLASLTMQRDAYRRQLDELLSLKSGPNKRKASHEDVQTDDRGPA